MMYMENGKWKMYPVNSLSFSPTTMTPTTTTAAAGTHILVFPYPAQGHILPLLDLTHQLLTLHINLTITILVTPKNLPILTPLLSTHPSSIQTLVLPFPPHPSIPDGVENVRDIGNHGNVPIITALSKLHSPITQWFKSHHNPPVAILSDFFLGWTSHLGRELGIPRIVFFSSGAFLASVSHYCWRNLDKVRSLHVVDFPDLPGSPSFKEEHLPSMFRFYRESDPDWALVKDSVIENFSSWGCVFNSFDALEGQYMDYLRKEIGYNGRVYGVGPLSLTAATNLKDPGNLNHPDQAGCNHVLNWLDKCPDGSVVYVCFGSQKLLKSDQMEALAIGLERSGIRFVWVVKTGTTTQEMEDGYGLVPNGFEERVSDRGIVVKGWAPQVLILNHQAVGGFLSHCGWNSVLEGIVAGVMILAWPMEADQFVNARLLVEDMEAAVRVSEEGANAVPDSNELARTIAESLSENIPQRVRAKELRGTAMAAVREGGSSLRDLNALVRELSLLQSYKR